MGTLNMYSLINNKKEILFYIVQFRKVLFVSSNKLFETKQNINPFKSDFF